MREAIGGTWLMQLVIIFMLIFVAFLALSLNYTKAFKMKNEVLTIIEKYEGLTNGDEGSVAIINNYLKSNGYHTTKACPVGSYGVRSLDNSVATLVGKNDKNKYYYCVTKFKKNEISDKDKKKAYYKVNLFLKFNLPVLGDIFTFEVNGTTGDVAFPADDLRTKN